jgi:hypothetical protein
VQHYRVSRCLFRTQVKYCGGLVHMSTTMVQAQWRLRSATLSQLTMPLFDDSQCLWHGSQTAEG